MGDDTGVFNELSATHIHCNDIYSEHINGTSINVSGNVSVQRTNINADGSIINADGMRAKIGNSKLNIDDTRIEMASSSIAFYRGTNLQFGKLTISTSSYWREVFKPCKVYESCLIHRDTELTADFDHIVSVKFNPLCFHCTHFDPVKTDIKKTVEEHYKDKEVDQKLEIL